MDYLREGMTEALRIISRFDPEFLGIVWVSVRIAFLSTALAALIGVPFGILLAQTRFPGRQIVITLLHTLMSLPTVVVGLMFYSLLSYRGPFGAWKLLYTQTAMVIGQFVLAFPIVAGLAVNSIRGMDPRIQATVVSLGADTAQGIRMFLHEARFGILAAVVAGFGRVFAEVGVSMMLGGNIRGYTRNIPTTIALETSKGEFGLGIALGLVLLGVAFAINALLTLFQRKGQ